MNLFHGYIIYKTYINRYRKT